LYFVGRAINTFIIPTKMLFYLFILHLFWNPWISSVHEDAYHCQTRKFHALENEWYPSKNIYEKLYLTKNVWLHSDINPVQLAGCNRTYTGDAGQIFSPGWPGRYPQNANCRFNLTTPTGTSIALYFNTFRIEPHSDCHFDYLQVRLDYHLSF